MKLARISSATALVVAALRVAVAVGGTGCGACAQECDSVVQCPFYVARCSNGEAATARMCLYSGCCEDGAELCADICADMGVEVSQCELVDY